MPSKAYAIKQRGKGLGQELSQQLKTTDFEALRQLCSLFPKIRLSYGNDYSKIKARLLFQLSMWLGDYYNQDERDRKKLVAQKLKPELDRISDANSWEMYQHFYESLLAEFRRG